MLIRSGAHRRRRHRLGRRAGAARRDRGRDGRQPRRPAGPADVPGAAQDHGRAEQHQTTAIFINQLREKIGVMFGCMSYGTRVTLADGTQEKIGKIVNQKMDVEVLSYDPETGQIVPQQDRQLVRQRPRRAVPAVHRREVRAATAGRSSRRPTNHLIRTPGGWREAGELIAGDRVMLAEPHRLSDAAVAGGPRLAHGRREPVARTAAAGQAPGSAWATAPSRPRTWTGRSRCSATSACSRTSNAKGAVFADFTPLPELAELREAVYFGDGKKHLSLGLPQGAHAARAGDLVHGRRLLHRAVEGRPGADRRAAPAGSRSASRR